MRTSGVLFVLGIIIPQALCQLGLGVGEMMEGLLPPGMGAFALPMAMRMFQGGGQGGTSGNSAPSGGTGGSGGGMDLMTMAALSGAGGMGGMGQMMNELMPAMALSNLFGGGGSTSAAGSANMFPSSSGAQTPAGGLPSMMSTGRGTGMGLGMGTGMGTGMGQGQGQGQDQGGSRQLLMTLAVTGHINKVNMMPTPAEARTLAREGVVGIPPNIKMLVCPRPKGCLPPLCTEPEKTFTRSSYYVCNGCPICRESPLHMLAMLRGLGGGASGGGTGGAGDLMASLLGVQPGGATGGSGNTMGMLGMQGGMGSNPQAQALAQMRAQVGMTPQMGRQMSLTRQLGSQMGMTRQIGQQMAMVPQMRMSPQTGMIPQMGMTPQIGQQMMGQQFQMATPVGVPGSITPNQGHQTSGQTTFTHSTRHVESSQSGGGSGGSSRAGGKAIVMPGPLSPQLIKKMRQQARTESKKMWGNTNNRNGPPQGPAGNSITVNKRRLPPPRRS